MSKRHLKNISIKEIPALETIDLIFEFEDAEAKTTFFKGMPSVGVIGTLRELADLLERKETSNE